MSSPLCRPISRLSAAVSSSPHCTLLSPPFPFSVRPFVFPNVAILSRFIYSLSPSQLSEGGGETTGDIVRKGGKGKRGLSSANGKGEMEKARQIGVVHWPSSKMGEGSASFRLSFGAIIKFQCPSRLCQYSLASHWRISKRDRGQLMKYTYVPTGAGKRGRRRTFFFS